MELFGHAVITNVVIDEEHHRKITLARIPCAFKDAAEKYAKFAENNNAMCHKAMCHWVAYPVPVTIK